MATMNAEAWQQSGVRPDGYSRPARPDYRSMPVERTGRPARGSAQPPRRSSDRGRAPERPRPADRGRPSDRGRPVDRDYYDDDRPRSRRPDPRYDRGHDREPVRRPSARDDRARGRAQAPERGGRVRGFAVVLCIFLVTLAGAAVDSFVGIGLGIITLGTLVASTAIGTLVVRRRDLASVVIAPPLVFVAVAGLNIALAPSATLNAATVATLLIRGFPTMGIATGVALVLALGRLVARR
jgi:hypothetical protein